MKWSERQLLQPSALFAILHVRRIYKNSECSLATKTLTMLRTLSRVCTKGMRLLCHNEKKNFLCDAK